MTAFQTKTRHLRYILCPVKGEISPSFVHVQARGYLGKRENVKICVLSNKNKTDDYSPGQLPSSLLRLGNNSSTDSKNFVYVPCLCRVQSHESKSSAKPVLLFHLLVHYIFYWRKKIFDDSV